MTQYKTQSSANNRIDELIPALISLVYDRNIRGPRTVPCGTPDKTFELLDVSPSTTTF